MQPAGLPSLDDEGAEALSAAPREESRLKACSVSEGTPPGVLVGWSRPDLHVLNVR